MTTASPLEIQIWPIDRLVLYARNPRKNDAVVDRMCSIIRDFGFKIPVLARSDGEVVDGHLRIKAARKLRIDQIPVILCDKWSPAQVKAFRLMVNLSVSWASWDDELLALELQELSNADFDLSLTGFDDAELAELLATQDAIEGFTDEDAVPPVPETPISTPGDLWALGTHKLLVGDATDSSAVGRLMAGSAADLGFTDPPYNVVADAPWDDEAVLDRCLDLVMPAMLRRDPVVAWVVDDTGFPKKGRESVGVAQQYCGQVGKQENCRVAVSLSVTTEKASMPVAFRLYLPESWVEDRKRRKKTGVPESIQFQTKPEIALDQIGRARERGIPQGVVLADAGYGTDTKFRAELTKLEMAYVVGVQGTTTVWKPGEQPKPAPARKGTIGRLRKLLQRDTKSQPVAVKELARLLPTEAWKNVTWRQGVKQKLQSRFAAMRVRPAHRDYWRSEPHPEEWLLIEWPAAEPQPTKYWLSTLPADTAPTGTGALGQTSLDHRTGLSGTEAGTRVGTL